MDDDIGVDRTDEVVDGISDAAERIENAVAGVEKAIKEKWSTPQMLGFICVGLFIYSLAGDIWHAKWRYALTYGVNASDVYVQDEPHDCNFFAAPLGAKYCHFERMVSTVRWAKSTAGNPIISWDEGKTWSSFDPEGKSVPQYSTVETVYINWEKKEE